MIDDVKLAELISAKFCHDIASPLGAVNNGVEFLSEDDPDMQEQAKSLIKTSAEQAVIKLQFLRQVYGYIADDASLDLAHIKDITKNYLNIHNVKIEWDVNRFEEMPHRYVKLVLNLILVIASSLIGGGKIEIGIKVFKNHTEFSIVGVSKNYKFNIETEQILKEDFDLTKITSRNIQTYYALRILKLINGKLEVEKTDDTIGFLVSIDNLS